MTNTYVRKPFFKVMRIALFGSCFNFFFFFSVLTIVMQPVRTLCKMINVIRMSGFLSPSLLANTTGASILRGPFFEARAGRDYPSPPCHWGKMCTGVEQWRNNNDSRSIFQRRFGNSISIFRNWCWQSVSVCENHLQLATKNFIYSMLSRKKVHLSRQISLESVKH